MVTLDMDWVQQVQEKANKQSHGETVFIAGIDIDGQLRGKFLPGKKLQSLKGKAPFCGVVFGWDVEDEKYETELKVSNANNGYKDLGLVIDPQAHFDSPDTALAKDFYLGFFLDDEKSLCCPRSVLRNVMFKYEGKYFPKTGCEIEWYNYNHSPNQLAVATPNSELRPLTHGMHGYSALRPFQNSRFWKDILKQCELYNIEFDTFHSETGPGVYEVAFKYKDSLQMADSVTLFKYAVRNVATKYAAEPNSENVYPCFMAKPQTGMPGNSGHLHCSIMDKSNNNVFSRKEQDPNPPFQEVAFLSDEGRAFLQGLMDGLDDVMVLFCPNINSYKRLDPRFWAPSHRTWGYENRLASVRLIDATSGSKSCRFEVRVPGSDLIPHFAIAAIYGLGYRGIALGLKLVTPPVRSQQDFSNSPGLPTTLESAINKFAAPKSLAREIFGDTFVDHYAATRKHELLVSSYSVTDFERRRYMETA